MALQEEQEHTLLRTMTQVSVCVSFSFLYRPSVEELLCMIECSMMRRVPLNLSHQILPPRPKPEPKPAWVGLSSPSAERSLRRLFPQMKCLEAIAVLQSSLLQSGRAAQRASRTLPVACRQQGCRQVTAKGFKSSVEVAIVRASFHRRDEKGVGGNMCSSEGNNGGEGNERHAAAKSAANFRHAQGVKAEA